MADLAGSQVKVNDIETAQNAPVSEATVQKVGGAINYLLDLDLSDRVDLLETTPVQTTLSVPASAEFAPLVTGTKLTVVANGRPMLFILNGGSISGSQTVTLKSSSFTVGSGTGTGTWPTTFNVLTPAAGSYNLYFERNNSVGSTTVSSLQVTIIYL